MLRKSFLIFLAGAVLVTVGCAQQSRIENVSDEVYVRGIEFINYMDENQMIGEQEGEDRLNAIATDDAPDSEVLFEDVVYILWVYHNLKSVDTAAEEMNQRRAENGIDTTVQQQYENIRDSILAASTQDELWEIWNTATDQK
jgi:hypothetical protein